MQSGTLACVRYLSTKWQQSSKLRSLRELFLVVENEDVGNFKEKIIV